MIFLRSSGGSIVRVTHEDRLLTGSASHLRMSKFLGIGLLCLSAGIGVSATAQSSGQSPLPSQNSQQAFTPAPLDAGFGPLDTAQPKGITPQQIIQRFAEKETQFKRALENYTYRRTVKLDSIGDNGSIDGEYLQVDDIVLSPSGRKQEKVVYAPDNTLTRALLSPADFDDIEHRLPFTLTTEDVSQYQRDLCGHGACRPGGHICVRRSAAAHGKGSALFFRTHLGRRQGFSDCRDQRKKYSRRYPARSGRSFHPIHDVSPADRWEILVPGIYHGRKAYCTSGIARRACPAMSI